MKTLSRIALLAILLTACGAPGPTPTPEVLRLVPETPAFEWQQICPSGDYAAEPQPDGGVLITCYPMATATDTDTATATETETPAPTDTATAEPTSTDTVTPAPTDTPTSTETAQPSETPAPTETPAASPTPVVAYAGAPLCPDHGTEHDTHFFHTIWDVVRGCHYEHEHGRNPFVAEVSARFPFDIQALQGGVQIGHTNPSSPAENTLKHEGFKWQYDLNPPNGCAVGFEGGTVAVTAYAVQFHMFGPQSIEFEARQHSAAAALELCKPGTSQRGYLYVVTLQEYGQRIMPYQGQVLNYPDNFLPTWASNFGQYFSTEGYGNCAGGRPNLAYYDNALNHNNLTVWASKPTGPVSQQRPPGSKVFNLLARGRDAYQSNNCADTVYPYTYSWACSLDGGVTYAAFMGCRYNNSSITVQELKGTIPQAWDGQAWDLDSRPNFVTATGFTDRYGNWRPQGLCIQPGFECYPIVMVNVPTGVYSTDLCAVKCSNPTPTDTPERDIYFCGANVCAETAPGARPSGWIGPAN